MDAGMLDGAHAEEQITDLLRPYGGYRLTADQLSACPGGPAFGWEIPVNVRHRGRPVRLRLQFHKSIEGCIPEVYVSTPDIKPLELPHVEASGRLCILPSNAIIDTTNYAYLVYLLARAEDLLSKAVTSELDRDFQAEILSYWAYHCKQFTSEAISLCDLNNQASREIYCFSTKAGLVYADSEADLIRWLDNRQILVPPRGEKPHGKVKARRVKKPKRRERMLAGIRKSMLLAIDGAWAPSDYPSTISDLLAMVPDERSRKQLATMLCHVLMNDSIRQPGALVTMQTSTGPCVLGLRFERNLISPKQNDWASRPVLTGFRDALPLQVLVNRCRTMKVFGQLIRRMDNSWVYGRDKNPAVSALCQHRVAIIGCGSVGAAIAKLLLQSGITTIDLWDDELLGTENCSRHVLGLNSAGMAKVSALKTTLASAFPNATITANANEWTSSESACLEAMCRADIVVSCTADWTTDQQLLRAQSHALSAPPIVFAMVEAHAMAGHVIVNPSGSEAFNSLHHCSGQRVGALRVPVIHWQGARTTHQVPACGGIFQPYGVVPLTHIQALAARVVLSLIDDEAAPTVFVWLGSSRELIKLGGQWNESWIEAFGDPGTGDRVVELEYTGGGDGWKVRA